MMHWLTRKHVHGIKAGVGEFVICSPRWHFGRSRIQFRRGLPGAKWQEISDLATLDSLLPAQTPEEASRLVTAAAKEDAR